MPWVVEDNPTSAATAAETTALPAAKRSNAKRKKSTLSTPTHDEDNHSTTTTTTTTGQIDDAKDEPAKSLSKSQRKRARHQGSTGLSEEEKSWSKISLFDVPEMPSRADATPTANKKSKGNKKVASNNKKGGKKSGGEIVVADYGQLDDWGWAPVDTEGMMMDDLEGFLGLEELDGVDVAYEGTDETGKTVVFKHNAKAAATKKGKNLKHSEPLPVKEGEVYYDIDTFDDDTFLHQKGQEPQLESMDEDTIMAGHEDGQDMDVDEIPEESTVVEPATKNKKGKEKKTTAKEKKGQTKKDTAPVTTQTEGDKGDAQDESLVGDEQNASDTEATEKESKKSNKKERQRLKLEEFKARKAEAKAAKTALKPQEEPKAPYDPMDGVDPSFNISAWKEYAFSPMIENALRKLKFTKPSPIQEKALPLGLAGRDVVGVAETGSGKTLAFGLPIIQFLARQSAEAAKSKTPMKESLTALILTPTRELAIQVKDHLVAFTQFTGHHVVPIVGGMSVQKQTRQMDRNPAIIVATPGRLWELISTNPDYSERLVHVRFLVMDEADRMLESGHFQELTNILKLLDRKREVTSEWEQHVKENSLNEDGTIAPTSIARTDFEHNRQTFVFTATLSKELSLNLSKKKNYATSAKQSTEGSMESLMERIEFHDETPTLVNIVSDKIVASKLLEARIDCVVDEKDLHLYYFAKKYPGRTLVFVNSIDAIRRLVPMMQLLGVDALGMHAEMQQRQRLKNLDRFKTNPHAILIASDVAARGLDIPMVDHVIHYQVPRSGDIYVHRSGRTARAENEGISLLLCGPDEVQLYRKICVTLKKDNGIAEFPVDHSVLAEMKKRVALAKKIDEQEHRIQKAAHQDDWMRKSAEAMDIILDDDLLNSGPKSKGDDDMDNSVMTARKNKIKGMRAELKMLLQKPLMPKGASAKYITSGSIRDLADRLRDANHNPSMPAHMKTTALEDIKAHRKITES